MNIFLKNSLRILGLLLIVSLAACSDNDNDNDNADLGPTAPASNEGIWDGPLAIDGENTFDVSVVFSDGKVMIIPHEDDDKQVEGMFSGTYTSLDNDVNIDGEAAHYVEEFADTGIPKADGATMFFSGVVTEQRFMSLDFEAKDENGDIVATGTIDLEFTDDGHDSSIASIEGSWTTDDNALTITVDGDGDFGGQFEDDACVISGTISILDPGYNLYEAASTLLNCINENDNFDGVYGGLAAVAYDENPDLFTIVGSNSDYMFLIDFNRD